MDNSFGKKNLLDVIIGLVLFSGSLAFLLNMHKYVDGGTQSTVGPLVFPKFIITLTVVLSFLLLIFAVFKAIKRRKQTEDVLDASASLPAAQVEKTNTINIVIYLGILFGYIFMMHFFGFLISTPIVMLLVIYILNGRNFKAMIPMSIGFSFIIYYVALKLMKIILPAGTLFD